MSLDHYPQLCGIITQNKDPYVSNISKHIPNTSLTHWDYIIYHSQLSSSLCHAFTLVDYAAFIIAPSLINHLSLPTLHQKTCPRTMIDCIIKSNKQLIGHGILYTTIHTIIPKIHTSYFYLISNQNKHDIWQTLSKRYSKKIVLKRPSFISKKHKPLILNIPIVLDKQSIKDPQILHALHQFQHIHDPYNTLATDNSASHVYHDNLYYKLLNHYISKSTI